MREERLEILKMVSDGVIGVEDAERLLEALEAGERKAGRRKVGIEDSLGEMGRGFADVGRGMAGMGKTIATSVDQALRGALKSAPGASHPVTPDGPVAEIDVPAGATLRIWNSALGDGSVQLLPADGERCLVRSAAVCTVRKREARRGREECVEVLWPGGDIEVEVPRTAGSVEVKAHGGSIEAADIPVPIELTTMRGDVVLTGVSRAFSATTFAGSIEAEILEIDGPSKAASLAGNLEIRVGPEFRGVVHASSLAGELEVEDDLVVVVQPPIGRVPITAVYRIGASGEEPKLELDTKAGCISLGRA